MKLVGEKGIIVLLHTHKMKKMLNKRSNRKSEFIISLPSTSNNPRS